MFTRISNFLKSLLGVRPCATMAQLRKHIKPGDVIHLAHWISQSIWYEKDKEAKDEWLEPSITLKRRRGDCEDMALVAHGVISQWPLWSAMLMCVYWSSGEERKGHAVCCFERPDGTRGYIDGNVYMLKGKSWKEIAINVAKGVDYATWVTEKGEVISRII